MHEKQSLLKEVRQDIKKNRLVFDEGKDKFGMDELSQLTNVKNTSEVKGYPFKTCKSSYKNNLKLALKIVPIELKYDKHEHPCHIENLVLKELTENIIHKNISPHIAYYLGTQKVSNKSRALKHLNLKRLEVEGKIRTHSNMLISEYVCGGSLDNWVFDTYESDKSISDEQWKYIVFQLIYTLATLQHHYQMMHNDFHYGNILIDNTIKPGGYLVYKIAGKEYYIKNTGVIPKLWDFEFTMVYKNTPGMYKNKFVLGYEHDKIDSEEEYNVPVTYNEVYDLHYFLCALLDLYISQELFDWIIKVYDSRLIPEEDSSSSSESSSTEPSTMSSSSSITSSTSSNPSTSKSSSSRSSSSSKSISTSTSTEYKKFLCEGRLINGIEKEFDLPNPLGILDDPFFKEFLVKPADFDSAHAVYFDAGF